MSDARQYMPYGPIQGQGQGQGHVALKVKNSFIFIISLVHHFSVGAELASIDSLTKGQNLNLVGPDF